MTKYASSIKWYEFASKYLVGGVAAGGRYNPVLGRQLILERGDGCRVWDIDGNEFIDYSTSSGATFLGHNHPAIREAVAKAMDLGVICTQETKHHALLAEKIHELIPSADMVRLSNTGTEATIGAIRVARAFTGRDKIVSFEGHFHGMHDYVFFNWHSTLGNKLPSGQIELVPDTAGVPEAMKDLILMLPFNDHESMEAVLERHKDEIAAVILEPICYNLGCIPSKEDWLKKLRELTDRYGIVLIFDEVLSGFRTGPGCAQDYYGVTPDLTTLAKALGSGIPIAALAGKKEVMECLGPLGTVVMSGTYTGHPIAVLSALAVLEEITKPGFYDRLNSLAQRLYSGIDQLLQDAGLVGHVQGLGTRFGIFFGCPDYVWDLRQSASNFSEKLNNQFIRRCFDEGLYFHDYGARIAPMHYGLTASHTENDIDESLGLLERVFSGLTDDA